MNIILCLVIIIIVVSITLYYTHNKSVYFYCAYLSYQNFLRDWESIYTSGCLSVFNLKKVSYHLIFGTASYILSEVCEDLECPEDRVGY